MAALRWSAGLVVLLGMALSAAAQTSTQRFVHDSWVPLRSSATSSAPIIQHVHGNQSVKLLGTQEKWCEIEAAPARGFLPCESLGDAPLTPADNPPTLASGETPNPQYSPSLAFWISPSVQRLAVAGQYFHRTRLTDKQRDAEDYDKFVATGQEFNWEKPPAIVRFAIPEFDAMKRVVAAGLVAPAEYRPKFVAWGRAQAALKQPGDGPVTVDEFWVDRQLANAHLRAVKPSLFKSMTALAPAYATVEQLSAQFGVPMRLAVTGPAAWVTPRHENPRVGGIWDIGASRVALEAPVVQLVIGRQGLLGAARQEPVEENQGFEESYCDSGFAPPPNAEPLSGYPEIKDPLGWVYLPQALPYKKATVIAFARRLDQAPVPGENYRLSLSVTYEIDIDLDSQADLAIWQGHGDAGESGDMVVIGGVFANIGGAWHLVSTDRFQECT